VGNRPAEIRVWILHGAETKVQVVTSLVRAWDKGAGHEILKGGRQVA